MGKRRKQAKNKTRQKAGNGILDFGPVFFYTARMQKAKKAKSVLTALFAALICAGCFIQIPIAGMIPVVLQDMLAILAGLILGPLYGTLAVFIFLLLGCIGLPVFSGAGGLAAITEGPTGGFLTGYLLGALAGGLIAGKKSSVGWLRLSLAAAAANLTVFLCGAFRFSMLFPESDVWALAVLPFLPGTVLKLIFSVPAAKKFRIILVRYYG